MEKNAWAKAEKNAVFSFCDKYMNYLDMSKTERMCVSETERIAQVAGFRNIDSLDKVAPGDKVYKINRG